MNGEFDVTSEDLDTATELLSGYESETVGKWDLISDLSDAFGGHKIKYMFVLSDLMRDGLIDYRETDDVFVISVNTLPE